MVWCERKDGIITFGSRTADFAAQTENIFSARATKKKDIKIDLLLIVRTAKIYIFELCARLLEFA